MSMVQAPLLHIFSSTSEARQVASYILGYACQDNTKLLEHPHQSTKKERHSVAAHLFKG